MQTQLLADDFCCGSTNEHFQQMEVILIQIRKLLIEHYKERTRYALTTWVNFSLEDSQPIALYSDVLTVLVCANTQNRYFCTKGFIPRLQLA